MENVHHIKTLDYNWLEGFLSEYRAATLHIWSFFSGLAGKKIALISFRI